MSCKVLIRTYQYGDEAEIKNLLKDAAMSTVWPFFFSSARREIISQMILLLAAVLFVVVGTPLRYSLLAFPIVIALLFLSTWIGHLIKVISTHNDLNNIPQEYTEKPKCGFWVAEAFGDIPNETPKRQIEILREQQISFANINQLKGNHKGKIIGTVAITIKHDPDLKEPPNSVAWLRRMAVSKSYQRLGIGSVLTDVALEHCSESNFRAVELLTTEHHQAARSLYAVKGFDLIETIRKPFLGGLLFLVMYRLRIPCILTRSRLNENA